MLALNVGSGQRKFTTCPSVSWLNIDINPKWEPDIVADCSDLGMIESGTVDIVVSHHCIEHVGLGEFDAAIREAYRVLKPSGSFIITTPDLRALAHAWIQGRITDYIFCVQLYGAYMNHEADRHKWLYTEDTLKQAIGFYWSKVKLFDWRMIDGADIAKDWYILAIEAIK